MSKQFVKIKFIKFKPNYKEIDETEKHKHNSEILIVVARLILLGYAIITAQDIANSTINLIAILGIWLILK